MGVEVWKIKITVAVAVGSGVSVKRGVGVKVALGVRVGIDAEVRVAAAAMVCAMYVPMTLGSIVGADWFVVMAGTHAMTNASAMIQIRRLVFVAIFPLGFVVPYYCA